MVAWICSGLDKFLNMQGFSLVGYGCTTCIGNSGEIHESVAEAITDNGKCLSTIETFLQAAA